MKDDKTLPQPPIGIMPYYLHVEKRYKELNEAIERYSNAGLEVPQEWINEAQTLEGWINGWNKEKELIQQLLNKSAESSPAPKMLILSWTCNCNRVNPKDATKCLTCGMKKSVSVPEFFTGKEIPTPTGGLYPLMVKASEKSEQHGPCNRCGGAYGNWAACVKGNGPCSNVDPAEELGGVEELIEAHHKWSLEEEAKFLLKDKEKRDKQIIVDYFASLGVPDGIIPGDEVMINGFSKKRFFIGVYNKKFVVAGESDPTTLGFVDFSVGISRPKIAPSEKSPREIAVDLFEKHWALATNYPLDSKIKSDMKYVIDAIEEALTIKNEK